MKKMFFQFVFVYMFSLIVAILLLILKSESSEVSYFIVRILLFGYSVLTGSFLFTPRFTVGLLKKIFKNSVANPGEFPEGSVSWPYIVLFIFILDILFGLNLLIPIAVIVQSSYVLYRFAKIYKTIILMDSEE